MLVRFPFLSTMFHLNLLQTPPKTLCFTHKKSPFFFWGGGHSGLFLREVLGIDLKKMGSYYADFSLPAEWLNFKHFGGMEILLNMNRSKKSEVFF